jgi:hypothetical protein
VRMKSLALSLIVAGGALLYAAWRFWFGDDE